MEWATWRQERGARRTAPCFSLLWIAADRGRSAASRGWHLALARRCRSRSRGHLTKLGPTRVPNVQHRLLDGIRMTAQLVADGRAKGLVEGLGFRSLRAHRGARYLSAAMALFLHRIVALSWAESRRSNLTFAPQRSTGACNGQICHRLDPWGPCHCSCRCLLLLSLNRHPM
jgi:hypothetical protein